MKKSLKILLIFLCIILFKFITTYTINEIIIFNYNHNIFNSLLVKSLYIFNFNQSYIAYYNDGNILYQNQKYDIAIKKYQKALEKKPPQNKVCDVRINLSLSIIKQIDTSDYKTAFDQLEEAKSNLYNNNCASQIDNSGYSKDAEQLEEEIKTLQNQLNNSSNDSQPDNDDDNNKEEEIDSNIEEQLKEIEKNSNASRQSDIQDYENLGDYSYYSGKKW